MTELEVTTRVSGINSNCGGFFFLFDFINRNMTMNTYFVKMLLKSILKMSYNTFIHLQGWIQLLKEVSEKIVSLPMHQARFGATFQCPHSHIFCAFLSPFWPMISYGVSNHLFQVKYEINFFKL